MPGPGHFGKWIAYSSPTVADLDADGKQDVYLNSASYARGGYAAVRADGRPLWAEFHDNGEGSDGFGPVGDFDGDGNLEIAVPVLKGHPGLPERRRWQAEVDRPDARERRRGRRGRERRWCVGIGLRRP